MKQLESDFGQSIMVPIGGGRRRPRPRMSNRFFVDRDIGSLSIMAMMMMTIVTTSMMVLPISGFVPQQRRRPCFPRGNRRVTFQQGSSRSLTLPEDLGPDDDNDEHHTKKLDLNLVLIDHYDSFTYNLVDMLGQHCIRPPIVLEADASPEDVRRIFGDCNDGDDNKMPTVDGIILSPGPGNPQTCGPLASSLVEAYPHIPVLGVCLGHQILGTLYGARCTGAPTPVHGQVHPLHFLPSVEDDKLWQQSFKVLNSSSSSSSSLHRNDGGTKDWQVTRYHSLHVTDFEGTPLIPTATITNIDGQNKHYDDDDPSVIMAFRHESKSHYGVQFHPESIGSNHGWALLRAFCDICWDGKSKFTDSAVASTISQKAMLNEGATPNIDGCTTYTSGYAPKANALANEESDMAYIEQIMPHAAYPNGDTDHRQSRHSIEVVVYKVPGSRMEPWHVMKDILGDADYRFWLDTSDSRPDASSVLGAASELVEYWGQEAPLERQGVYVYNSVTKHAPTKYKDLDILTYLDQQRSQTTQSVTFLEWDPHNGGMVAVRTNKESPDILPFAFRGGHVGYLGYEVRHDTSDYLKHAEGDQSRQKIPLSSSSGSATPTAAFMLAEKSFVYQHDTKEWYLVGNVRTYDKQHIQMIYKWIAEQARILRNYSPSLLLGRRPPTRLENPVNFKTNRSKRKYNSNFNSCIGEIRRGESYELCLTNQIEATVKNQATPLDLYRILRRRNPAPYAAFFDWNSGQRTTTGTSFAICSSSPERFVSLSPQIDKTFLVEAKPIKGTCARVIPQRGSTLRTKVEEREDMRRAESLRFSVKNRAENLMIVDLLRNDISRVCRTGSVHVAKLMDIESFATVHQMVSTIRGTLNAEDTAISTLRACFPGGSMTGAPKLRTMDILDDLEEGVPRGPYSGCLGYIGVNGAMDMNIIIRTAVLTPVRLAGEWKISVGAGGAITILSESEDEYEEMILKASAVLGAVDEWASTVKSAMLVPGLRNTVLTRVNSTLT